MLPTSEPAPAAAPAAPDDATAAYARTVAELNLDAAGAQKAATDLLDGELFALTPTATGRQLTISSRARLTVTATRNAPSIQGVIASTMSGQGSLELRRLWTRADDPQPAVIQLPVVYAGWSHHSAVFALSGAQIVRQTLSDAGGEWKDAKTLKHVGPKSARATDDRFFLNGQQALNAFMSEAEAQLKFVFDAAWERRQKIVYPASPYLTKAVARAPVGLNGSSYTLASSVNDPLPGFSDAGVEALLRACLEVCCPEDRHKAAIERMAKRPSHADAKLLAEPFASALSMYQAITKPYRVDGTPVVLPGGTQMVEAESWLMEPSRSILTADDCDGSASCVLGVINASVALLHRAPAQEEAPGAFVHMRAVGRLFDTFYVCGVSVLGATAGHAAAATDDAPAVAGHAVAIALPKRAAARALAEGAAATIGKKAVHSDASETGGLPRCARRATPRSSRRRRWRTSGGRGLGGGAQNRGGALRHRRRAVERLDARVRRRAPGPPPLAMEGTAAADGRLYTHDDATRAQRHDDALHDKEVAKLISPCVARNCSRLDAAGRGAKHGFYSAFVELSLSTRSPLFDDARLRELNAATPHLVLINKAVRPGADVADPKLHGAGASPEQLAKNDFALVPLWTVGKRSANVLGAASAEASMNILPRRAGPLVLDKRQAQNLLESLSALQRLRRSFEKLGPIDDSEPVTEQVLSYAALVNNPRTVECYVDTLLENLPTGSRGSVSIQLCPHVAHFADQDAADAVAAIEAGSGDDDAFHLFAELVAGQKIPIQDFLRAASEAARKRADDAAPASMEAGRVAHMRLQVPRNLLPLLPDPPPAPAAPPSEPAAAPQSQPQSGGGRRRASGGAADRFLRRRAAAARRSARRKRSARVYLCVRVRACASWTPACVGVRRCCWR